MGEVELASREAVADGLYPSASSNGVEAIVSLRDNNVDCSVCRGEVAKERLWIWTVLRYCPAEISNDVGMWLLTCYCQMLFRCCP